MTTTMNRTNGRAVAPKPAARGPVRRRSEGSQPPQATRTKVLVITGLVLFLIYSLAPVWWLIVSATKSQRDLYTTNGLWFSNIHFWSNLRQLFTYQDGIFLT
ncbi:carbohydrate ABC transporter permease, partial [Streptomyces sp. MCAF7]